MKGLGVTHRRVPQGCRLLLFIVVVWETAGQEAVHSNKRGATHVCPNPCAVVEDKHLPPTDTVLVHPFNSGRCHAGPEGGLVGMDPQTRWMLPLREKPTDLFDVQGVEHYTLWMEVCLLSKSQRPPCRLHCQCNDSTQARRGFRTGGIEESTHHRPRCRTTAVLLDASSAGWTVVR